MGQFLAHTPLTLTRVGDMVLVLPGPIPIFRSFSSHCSTVIRHQATHSIFFPSRSCCYVQRLPNPRNPPSLLHVQSSVHIPLMLLPPVTAPNSSRERCIWTASPSPMTTGPSSSNGPNDIKNGSQHPMRFRCMRDPSHASRSQRTALIDFMP